MNIEQPPKSHFFAALWFSSGVALVAAAIAALHGKAPFIMPGLMMMSLVLFMLSAQRTKCFAVEETLFRRRMQIISFSAAILCSLSIVFNSALA